MSWVNGLLGLQLVGLRSVFIKEKVVWFPSYRIWSFIIMVEYLASQYVSIENIDHTELNSRPTTIIHTEKIKLFSNYTYDHSRTSTTILTKLQNKFKKSSCSSRVTLLHCDSRWRHGEDIFCMTLQGKWIGNRSIPPTKGQWCFLLLLLLLLD